MGYNQLTNNIVIVSGEQQRDSAIHMCIHSPPNSPPIQTVSSHWAEFHVLYCRSLLVIHLKYPIAALCMNAFTFLWCTRDSTPVWPWKGIREAILLVVLVCCVFHWATVIVSGSEVTNFSPSGPRFWKHLHYAKKKYFSIGFHLFVPFWWSRSFSFKNRTQKHLIVLHEASLK